MQQTGFSISAALEIMPVRLRLDDAYGCPLLKAGADIDEDAAGVFFLPPAGRDKKTPACQAANLSHIFTSHLFESIAVNYASFDFIVRGDGV